MTIRGIAGDWHGNEEWAVKMLALFADRGVERIYHLGDFGLWHDDQGMSFMAAVNKACGDAGMVIDVTLGNHENMVMFDAMPRNDIFRVMDQFPNIRYFERGARWTDGNLSFVSLGGANSIDRFTRHANINWWEGEQIGYGDIMRTREGGFANVMLTHDCPAGVAVVNDDDDSHGEGRLPWSEEAKEYAQHSRVAIRAAVDAVKPDVLFHGHFHWSATLTTDLTDSEGNPYTLKSVSMGKDEQAGNIGLLDVTNGSFELIN